MKNSNGTPDGGVHDLYTIQGRSDASGCSLAQPDFAIALATNNVIFRIATPLFGLGLVEATPDSVLQANLAATASARAALKIGGVFNTSGNDGTITRSGCADIVNFAAFSRLTAPATPAPPTGSTPNGASLFNSIGCSLCHSPSLTTEQSIFTGMSHVTYHPCSDFALHNMGVGLADGISQGAAKGNPFRMAPLWGAGQRLFFLHDGRTSDLIQAIQSHNSSGSEANMVIRKYNALTASQQQALLNLLRSS